MFVEKISKKETTQYFDMMIGQMTKVAWSSKKLNGANSFGNNGFLKAALVFLNTLTK